VSGTFFTIMAIHGINNIHQCNASVVFWPVYEPGAS
jgi:hypothetical protein